MWRRCARSCVRSCNISRASIKCEENRECIDKFCSFGLSFYLLLLRSVGLLAFNVDSSFPHVNGGYPGTSQSGKHLTPGRELQSLHGEGSGATRHETHLAEPTSITRGTNLCIRSILRVRKILSLAVSKKISKDIKERKTQCSNTSPFVPQQPLSRP